MLRKASTFLSLVSLIALPSLVFGAGSTDQGASAKGPIEYPKKAMELVVGFAAGGGNHLAAENLVADAQSVFGVPVTVTLKPGAGTAVANSYVKAAPADGYTLLNASISLPISLYLGTVDFKKEDFVGIAMFSNIAPCVVVASNFPANNLKELAAYAKANPKKFSWGHSGVAGSLQLAGIDLFDTMGIVGDLTEVPFKSTGEALAGVLGGHITGMVSYPSTVLEQVRAGKLKVLSVGNKDRISEFPNVPTTYEQGFNSGLTSFRGVFVRSDTPKEVIDILEKGFEKIITSESFKKRALELGEPPVYKNAKEMTAIYYDQCEKIAGIIEKLGLNK